MPPEPGTSAWFRCQNPHPQALLRLFCIPHAGGSASAYQAWSNILAPAIEVVSVQLPGRENRYFEPLYHGIEPLVQDLAQAIAPWLDKPFAIFGHSMGALVGFELARHLRRQDLPEPLSLYVAAFRAPHVP